MITFLSADTLMPKVKEIIRHVMAHYEIPFEFVELGTYNSVGIVNRMNILRETTDTKVLACGADAYKYLFPNCRRPSDYRLTQQSWSNLPVYYTQNPNILTKQPDAYQTLAEDIDFACITPHETIAKPEPPPYVFCDTEEKLLNLYGAMNWLKGPTYAILDIETSGLNCVEDFIRVIGIALNEKALYIVPNEMFEHDLLKDILTHPQIRWVGHNIGGFDSIFIRKYLGVELSIHGDTMLAHYLLDERQGGHRLNEVAAKTLYVQSWKDMVDDYATVPIKQLCDYLALDLSMNYRLINPVYKELNKLPTTAKVAHDELLIPGSIALSKLHEQGLQCDREYLLRLNATHRAKIEELSEGLRLLTDTDINVKSPKQVHEYLYQELALTKRPAQKSSAMCTDEAALTALQHPVADQILMVRRYRQIKSTFVEGLLQRMDLDNRIRMSYKLHGTVTGRLSCSNPNLQQVPSSSHEWFCDDFNIKNAFYAPEDFVFVEFDYSQLELRIAGWYSEDPYFINAYQNNLDIHRLVAADAFGVPESEVTKVQRSAAKKIDFGIIYRIGPKGLADQLTLATKQPVSAHEAKALINRFSLRIPEFNRWANQQENHALQNNYVETPTGRRRRFHCILESNRNEVRRQAVNTPIQSLASDICLHSLIRLSHGLDSRAARVALTVHDSILFEVHKNHIPETVQYIKEIMENPTIIEYRLPITVEAKIGERYGSMEELKL